MQWDRCVTGLALLHRLVYVFRWHTSRATLVSFACAFNRSKIIVRSLLFASQQLRNPRVHWDDRYMPRMVRNASSYFYMVEERGVLSKEWGSTLLIARQDESKAYLNETAKERYQKKLFFIRFI
jgi:hypothetical protein